MFTTVKFQKRLGHLALSNAKLLKMSKSSVRALATSSPVQQINIVLPPIDHTTTTRTSRVAQPHHETNLIDKHWGARKMRAWQISNYGGPTELLMTENARVPIIKSPFDLLIEVKAASVNPIDVQMTKGYGADLLKILRTLEKRQLPTPWNYNNEVEFPLTFGRDFAGIVKEIGSGVNNVRVGDEVYGVLNFTEHGSHADYTVANCDLVQRKPAHLSFAEAASLPYVALTCWSAVTVTGNYLDMTNKRFLVLGGSGGVGTFAVQYLKAYGAIVIATGSGDSIELLESLGVNAAVDYTQANYEENLRVHGPFDCILNLSGPRNDLEKHYSSLLTPITGQYITLSPPALNNIDQYGLVGGVFRSAADLLQANLTSLFKDQVVTKWAFFVPSSTGFRSVADVIASGRIRPIIHKTYPFQQAQLAYNEVDGGHLRGKVVLDTSAKPSKIHEDEEPVGQTL